MSTDTTAAETKRLLWVLVFLVLLVIMAAGVIKIQSNYESRNDPPAACYLYGGHWSWFSGWSCG